MNWEAIAAAAELLGALGVIGSLVYLAGQVRGSLNQARQAAIQSLVQQMNNVWTRLSADREQADIWVRGSKGVTMLANEDEGVRFSAFLLSIWTWESIGSQCHALMGTPGFRDWWHKRGNWFSSDFRRHIEETLESHGDYERWGQ